MLNFDKLFGDDSKNYSKPTTQQTQSGIPDELLEALASGKAEFGAVEGEKAEQLLQLLAASGADIKPGQPIAIDGDSPVGKQIAAILGIDLEAEKRKAMQNAGAQQTPNLADLLSAIQGGAPSKKSAPSAEDLLKSIMSGDIPDFNAKSVDDQAHEAFVKKYGDVENYVENVLDKKASIYSKAMVDGAGSLIKGTGQKEDANALAYSSLNVIKEILTKGLIANQNPIALATQVAAAAATFENLFDNMDNGQTAKAMLAITMVLQRRFAEFCAEAEGLKLIGKL